MSVSGFFRFAERTHPLFLPAVFAFCVGSAFTILVLTHPAGYIRDSTTDLQLVGTLILYTFLPPYFLAIVVYQRRRTLETLNELAAFAMAGDAERVRHRTQRLPAFAWLGGLLGFGFGAAQNPEAVRSMLATRTFEPLDVAFVLSACLIWSLVAMVLCFRLPASLALSAMGERLAIDLYRLDRIRSLGRLATSEILVVAGAMAFMPLQSLDAEFRPGNYQPGVLVGVPAAAIFFLTPLWGVHRSIQAHKRARIDELQVQVAHLGQNDLVALEALCAHIDRVRALASWPIDHRLITRVFVYVVIPPLAWIASAVVQSWIERL